jgi:hypothetical protein
VLRLPCSILARDAGDDRFVSIVALGGLLAARQIVPLAAIPPAIRAVVGDGRPELAAADEAAFRLGYLAAGRGAAAQPAM